MSTRGGFGIIRDQAKPIAAAGELAHDGLGIVDDREMGRRRFAQKSVDLPKKRRIGRPSQQCRPARRKDARRLIDQRRVGSEVRAVDKAALCGERAVKVGVAAGQMSQDGLNRESPGAIEIDECAVLIEQDCTNWRDLPCWNNPLIRRSMFLARSRSAVMVSESKRLRFTSQAACKLIYVKPWADDSWQYKKL